MNFDRPHQPCCPQHNTCQACDQSWPCQDELARQLAVAAAERAVLDARVTGLLEQLDEWRARCERTAVLTATTEGGESR